MVLKFLSPVHVGSGQELQKGIDYDFKDNSLFFIDQEKLFNALVEKNESGLIEDYFNKCLSTNFFDLVTKLLKLDPNNFVHMNRSFFGEMKPTLKEFNRDGNGKYYIPGSSIKGAIKSIYFEKELQNNTADDLINQIKLEPGKKPNKTRAASKLMRVFSRTTRNPREASNFDLFRTLQFKDFELQDSDIGIIQNLILSLQFDKTLKEKETKISYAQAVKPGSEIVIDKLYKLDKMLFKAGKMQNTLRFNAALFNEQNFIEIVNSYAKKTIASEIEFFNNHPHPEYKDKIIKFYNDLLNKLKNNKTKIIFRMSAGSGWKFMTGNITLATDRSSVINTIRRIYPLGKDRVDIFPKTRRIAVCENGDVYPLGWVEVDYGTPNINSVNNKEANKSIDVTQVKPKPIKETFIQKNSNRTYNQG
nr:type III-A CRISPR-associated RAMP protein Csm5 [Melioribacteraceae bacterium]